VIDQDEFIMGAMEWCAYIKHLHNIPLKQYGKLSGDQFQLIDRIRKAARGD
jgi:hypothetical protein